MIISFDATLSDGTPVNVDAHFYDRQLEDFAVFELPRNGQRLNKMLTAIDAERIADLAYEEFYEGG